MYKLLLIDIRSRKVREIHVEQAQTLTSYVFNHVNVYLGSGIHATYFDNNQNSPVIFILLLAFS